MGRIAIFVGFFAVVILANLLILDIIIVSQRNSLNSLSARVDSVSEGLKTISTRSYTAGITMAEVNDKKEQNSLTLPTVNACPNTCISMIRAATVSATTRTQVITRVVPSTTTTTANTSSGGSRGEFFVPLGSGSVSSGGDWADVATAQATFNPSNFGTIKAAYFEVFLKIGAGEVSARLFDTTTPAILFSSEVKTTSATGAFVSAPIVLSAGDKTYRVQMKSTISTGELMQARIRIVVN